jgi:putative ABC transport system permease protein
VAGTSHQRHVSDPHKLAGSLPEGFDEPQAVLAGLPRLVEVVLEQHGVPGAKALGVQNERRIVENHVVLAVDVLGAMALLLIAVGGFSLAMTMSLAVLERTREIGVLKAIGASHHSILVIVLVEGLVISVLGWLVALPASVPASWLLGDAFGRIMFNTPIAFTAAPAAAALWLGIAVVLAGVASLYPTYRALRVPAAEALARP